MRRREFIALVGGVAIWPRAARAQQASRKQRIGVLMGYADDPEPKSWIAALEQRLKELGWRDGENVHIEYRWAAGDARRIKTMAGELVGLKPDVLLAASSPALSALLDETRAVSIVFLNIYDPLGQGFVASLAHPGGNATGFSSFEDAIPGKTLELLKEIAPRVERVAVVFNLATAAYAPAQLRLIDVAAPSFGLQVIPTPVENSADIERALAKVASTPNSSLFVMSSAFISTHRQLIIELSLQGVCWSADRRGDRQNMTPSGLVTCLHQVLLTPRGAPFERHRYLARCMRAARNTRGSDGNHCEARVPGLASRSARVLDAIPRVHTHPRIGFPDTPNAGSCSPEPSNA